MADTTAYERPIPVDDLIALLCGLRSRSSIYTDIRAGRIRTVRLGQRYLVPASEVRRLTGQEEAR